jgi:hypothetical protein
MRKQHKELLLWGAAGAAAWYFFLREKEPAKNLRTPVAPVFAPKPKAAIKRIEKEAEAADEGPMSPGELWKREYDKHGDSRAINDDQEGTWE